MERQDGDAPNCSRTTALNLKLNNLMHPYTCSKTMLCIPFRVSNRFGEPLSGAIVECQQLESVRRGGPIGIASSKLNDAVVLQIINELPFRRGWKATVSFKVRWTDADHVVWGFDVRKVLPFTPAGSERGHFTSPEQGFTITSRMFPQEPLPPEISLDLRSRLMASKEGVALLDTYDECRDLLLAGFPRSSVIMAGKAIETAIIIQGKQSGWPVDRWKEDRYTLGKYLEEQLVKDAFTKAFSSQFLEIMSATNATRVLAAHQIFERIDLTTARNVQYDVTKLLIGWFTE